MNNFTFFISVLICASFTNCASTKKLQKSAPLAFKQAYYRTTADNNINFYVSVATKIPEVNLQYLYFKGLKSPIATNVSDNNMFQAYFNTGKLDFVMSGNPKGEYGNTLPQKPVKSPVELKKGQALLEYSKKGKTYYFVLTNIEERK
ncbi:hypothetical protein [Zunongwangia sp.]|uniref:hypothetical protein n=1 Tax=Zunongwangia sp. TaxID=1965325 RepID=UPI003AA96D93